jgi:hypothetical protein
MEVTRDLTKSLLWGSLWSEAQVKWVEEFMEGERMKTGDEDNSLEKLGYEGRQEEVSPEKAVHVLCFL